MSLTLENLNQSSESEFVMLLEDVYEHAPWVATQAATSRPFSTITALKQALLKSVRETSTENRLTFLKQQKRLLALNNVNQAKVDELQEQYQNKFGYFPIAAPPVACDQPVDDEQLIQTLATRLTHSEEFELAENIRHAHRIAELKLNKLLNQQPTLGTVILKWSHELAQHTDSGYEDLGQLTVTYLTDAHQNCAKQIAQWMGKDCGFDEVTIDAVGNVVGVYHGSKSDSPRLMTGSHYDTVRNGGKYDGRLGILAPMAVIRTLSHKKQRLPFGIEVVAFAEEEGQRYKAVFLGSSALTGSFDLAWLDQVDRDAVSMREAMQQAGLDPSLIQSLKRDPSNYLGFVEIHIEQGPVLNALDLPLGAVTSINGGVRMLGTVIGTASHAGTTPMTMRQDALTAVAQLALYLEQRAKRDPDLVGTIGMLEVPNGSINVIPGRCRFSLDIRATTDAVRDACVTDVKNELARICAERSVRFELEEIMRVAAAPSDPKWQARWVSAIANLGLAPFLMPSGAGHDAMKLHDIMPQAMLFVRGLNSGISHNPLEAITDDDAHLCALAFEQLLEQLSRELQ